jgi:hypothetical protein
MPLQSSGPISLRDINTEMNNGASGIISLNSFKSNGTKNSRGVTGIPSSGTISITQFYGKQAIPVVNGLVAKYTGESWNGTTLQDETGSNNNTNASKGGAISTFTSTINGLKYIYGGTTAGLQFPSTVLPSTYTCISLSKYNGASRQRILDGINNNWLSGHWGGLTGCAYHEGWIHYPNSTDYYSNTWVLSSDQNSLYRSNGIQRGTSGGSASTRLSINYGNFTGITYNSEVSDWAVYCIFVYDRTLTTSEILLMENYINSRYSILGMNKSIVAMNSYNWYTLFTRINANHTIIQTGSDPDVVLQLNSSSIFSSNTTLWYSNKIQLYSQFMVDFNINMSDGADGTSFNVGFNSTVGLFGEGPNPPGFCLTFHVWDGSRKDGIYLFDNNGNQRGYYDYAVGENVWRPVRIIYTRSTTNTWQIFFNNINIFNYSNPNNEAWVTSDSGDIFGFGSRTGGVTHNFYLRNFNLSLTE